VSKLVASEGLNFNPQHAYSVGTVVVYTCAQRWTTIFALL